VSRGVRRRSYGSWGKGLDLFNAAHRRSKTASTGLSGGADERFDYTQVLGFVGGRVVGSWVEWCSGVLVCVA